MSLLARRHALLQHDLYGEIVHIGIASSVADNGASAATPQSITPVAGMIAGDLCVVTCTARNDDNSPINVSNTGGQSWTSSFTYTEAGGDGQATKMFWCKFNGIWSANPTFSFTVGSATSPKTAVMNVFRSGSPVFDNWVFENNGAVNADSGSPIQIASITTVHPSTITLGNWYVSNASVYSAFSGAAGWQNITSPSTQFRNLAGLDSSVSFAWKYQKIPGAIGMVQKSVSLGSAFGPKWTSTWYQTLKIPT